MSLAIRRNDFFNFGGANEAVLVLVDRTFTGKTTLLAKLTSVIWASAFHVSNMGGGYDNE